jgi:hypothetical protein
VKTDLFGKHASPDALLWFLGVYYGKKETCKANKQSLLQAIGLEEEGPVLMIERGTSSQQIAIIRKTRCRPSISRRAFLNAITPPTRPQPASGCPVCPLLRNRGAQADTNAMEVSSTSGQMQRLVVPLAARLVHHQRPMETSEESDADAATSTPGGGALRL